MPHGDQTKILLQEILARLYRQQGGPARLKSDESYLIAQDGQYLGKITTNRYDNHSILNRYGPFGSRYSQTSIFNPYSPYGSKYGQHSINNVYTITPPKLIIGGREIGFVTVNKHIHNAISTEAFLYTLNNSIGDLLRGRILKPQR